MIQKWKHLTYDALDREFKKHLKEGCSAVSFRGRLSLGQLSFRHLLDKFPEFKDSYTAARETQRLMSFHGNKLGPKGDYYSFKEPDAALEEEFILPVGIQ